MDDKKNIKDTENIKDEDEHELQKLEYDQKEALEAAKEREERNIEGDYADMHEEYTPNLTKEELDDPEDTEGELSKSEREKREAIEAAKEREERNRQGDYEDIHEEYTPDIHDIPDEPMPKLSLGKILKYVGIGIVLLVYALLFMRIYLNNNTGVDMASEKICNTQTVEAYLDSYEKGETFDVYSQTMSSYYITLTTDDSGKPLETEKVVNSTFSESKAFRGMFSVSNFLYYKDSKQVVVTLRYNRESLNALKDAYHLSSLPEEPFYFALDDGLGFFSDYSYTEKKRFTYNYRRLIFNDIDLEDIKSLSLNIYYVNDVEFEAPLDFIKIYDSNIPLEREGFKYGTFNSPTGGLTKAPSVKTK